ncbi:MAG: ArnT family glycosyltransferase [Armatimonadota bacterium]
MTDEMKATQGPQAARWMLPVLLGAHLLLGTYYALSLPLWGAVPDEPLHYSAIKWVAEKWTLPVIEDPFRDLKEYYFVADPAGAAQHGPTYYWSAAIIYKLTDNLPLTTHQYVLRMYSVLLGLLTVYLAFLAFRLLFSDKPTLVFACTMLFTLMPHRLLMSAVMYADVMAILATTAALLAIIWCIQTRQGWRGWLIAGLVFGFDMITKTSAIVVLPGLLVTGLLLWRRHEWSLKGLLVNAGCFLAGTAAVSAWWLIRSVNLYGELFPTEPKPPGYGWLDVIFDPQFPWVLWMAVRGYWLSIWSQAGWLPEGLALAVYAVLLMGTLVTAFGLIAGLRGSYRGEGARTMALVWGHIVIGVVTLYAGLQRTILVSFHSNEQTGKHAQTILVAFIMLAVLGWQHLLGARRAVYAVWTAAGLMLLFNLLSIYNLETNLIPRFTPAPPPMSTWKVKDLPVGGIPWVKDRPNTPNRYLIHDQQTDQPAPQHGQGPALQQLSHAGNQQQRQAHHCNQHVSTASVELHIHGPEGPLLA